MPIRQEFPTRASLKPLLKDPKVQRFLAMIRYGEHQYTKDPYTVRFGGTIQNPKRFNYVTTKGHPDITVTTPNFESNAAGAYQFMGGPDQSWAVANREHPHGDNPNMYPTTQDIAALEMIVGHKGVDPRLPPTPQSIAKLAEVWASFPTLGGVSNYNDKHGKPQHTMTFGQLQTFYNEWQEPEFPYPLPPLPGSGE